jgi:hypothetical protein
MMTAEEEAEHAPSPPGQEDQGALERYYRRRLDELKEGLPPRHFVPIEELERWASELSGAGPADRDKRS